MSTTDLRTRRARTLILGTVLACLVLVTACGDRDSRLDVTAAALREITRTLPEARSALVYPVPRKTVKDWTPTVSANGEDFLWSDSTGVRSVVAAHPTLTTCEPEWESSVMCPNPTGERRHIFFLTAPRRYGSSRAQIVVVHGIWIPGVVLQETWYLMSFEGWGELGWELVSIRVIGHDN